MEFRARLLATLRAIRPVLEEPGVLIIGSEVPNLLEPGAAATLVVSQDVDVGVSVASHAAVKRRLREVTALRPSPDEPSVWVAESPDCIEVNFVGMDAAIRDASDTYVLDDRDLPLLVFGPLGFLQPGTPIEVEGLTVPVPRVAGLLVEKLLSDRSSEKGDRDRLVALGLVLVAGENDLAELEAIYRTLQADLRHAVISNLTILSLLEPRAGMPDPRVNGARVAALLRTLERAGEEQR